MWCYSSVWPLCGIWLVIWRCCNVLWMVSLAPCAVVLEHSLRVAVSVLWGPRARACLRRAVALPALCHFDDGGLSSVNHCVQTVASWWCTCALCAWSMAGHHSLLCHFDNSGPPLHSDMPGVWVHGEVALWRRGGLARLGRVFAGVRAWQTGWSAHFPWGDGDGGKAGFVLRDECGHGRIGLYVWRLRAAAVRCMQWSCCPYGLDAACPTHRSMGLECLCAVCPLQRSVWAAGLCGGRLVERTMLEGLCAVCFHQRGLPVGVWVGPWGELSGLTTSRGSWHPDIIPASPQRLPAHRSVPFVSRKTRFFWHLQHANNRDFMW